MGIHTRQVVLGCESGLLSTSGGGQKPNPALDLSVSALASQNGMRCRAPE